MKWVKVLTGSFILKFMAHLLFTLINFQHSIILNPMSVKINLHMPHALIRLKSFA
ncbi:hypothetical protein SBF1_1650005 [Candidatus Desulfosporosinus infrequens]|uniref:Uncharacterized protein n=1 Tax=Candidatus Desulfosporosinus infrequens TaxID=2043169 RepID=A0A2U3KAP9_9FIRM|nr:hypothetical protein SBF1_1650005 [Candidatus Desulfosporosinus infrequens]